MSKQGTHVKLPSFIQHLATEISRRKVLRVVAIYAVTAWVVLQVAETVFEPLGFPPWSMRAIIAVAIIGCPVSFLLAWIIDIRPDGLIFDLPLWVGDGDHPRPHKKTDLLYAALLGLLIISGTYYLVIRLIGGVTQETATVATQQPPANSIGVLAFENFGVGEEVDYFAAGLADEILNLLVEVSELNVASRTSSFQFRGKQVDIREIADLLNVRHVLEGSARKDGDRIRVVAQLINGQSGYHDWSATYERPLNNIFLIQEQIAAAVVNELKIALSVDSARKLQQRATEDIDAYIHYLEGRGRLRSSLDADVMITASQLFEKALAIDPEFSRAFAGLCETRLRLYEITNRIEDFQLAEGACNKAIALDPGLDVETKLALGKLYRYRGWYERAGEQLTSAIAIDPTAIDAYIELGEIRFAQDDRENAEINFLRAADLNINYWRSHEALGSFYLRTERYAEAADAYEIASGLAPHVASVFSGMGAVFWMRGDMPRSMDAYEESLRLKPSRQGYTNLGMKYYYGGQFKEAVEMQKRALEFAPDDHRVWGRLAESYRFTTGGEERAKASYAEAARHAETKLTINAEDWKTLGLLGLYYAYLERPDDAMRLINRSLALSRRNSEPLYFLALAHLRFGDQDSALDALEEAVASDARYATFIASDPDLQQIRGNERMIRLLATSAE
jgi:TolB-like protein/Flp pilus assembly protein TadD